MPVQQELKTEKRLKYCQQIENVHKEGEGRRMLLVHIQLTTALCLYKLFFFSNVTKILCCFLFTYQSSVCTNQIMAVQWREGREAEGAEQPAPGCRLALGRSTQRAKQTPECQGEGGGLLVNPSPTPWCCSSGWFGKVMLHSCCIAWAGRAEATQPIPTPA